MKFFSKIRINNKEDFLKILFQFVKFGMVGISNTAISLGFYYLFIWMDADLYMIGYLIGFVASVLNAYFWNRKFVFSSTAKGHTKPIVKSFVVYGATFLLGMLLLYFFVDYLEFSKKIAPLINLIITVPLNFLLIKQWALKESSKTATLKDKTGI